MYFDAIIVMQHGNSIKLITDSDTYPQSILDKAAVNAFPTGEAWHLFENARSFRFVQLTERDYLLSYTLVLGESHGTRNGRLHSWGLIGDASSLVGSDGLAMFAPQELFEFYINAFVKDLFFQAMVHGLAQAPPAKHPRSLTGWEKVKLYASRLGIVRQYDDPTQWAQIEQLVFQTFWVKMRVSTIWRRRYQPVTFSTLALSKRENTAIFSVPTRREDVCLCT